MRIQIAMHTSFPLTPRSPFPPPPITIIQHANLYPDKWLHSCGEPAQGFAGLSKRGKMGHLTHSSYIGTGELETAPKPE